MPASNERYNKVYVIWRVILFCWGKKGKLLTFTELNGRKGSCTVPLFQNMTHTTYAFMLIYIDICSVQNMLWKSSEYLNLDASDIVTIINTN